MPLLLLLMAWSQLQLVLQGLRVQMPVAAPFVLPVAAAAAANQTASSLTEEREHGVTAATATENEETARETPPESSSSGATCVDVHVDESSHQNRQQPGEQNEQQQGQRQQQEQSNSCFVPPFPDLPADMCLPENIREYLVVERTAHFVREVSYSKQLPRI